MTRVALVTGGSRGIGRAIAERLAADGLAVAVNYRSNGEAAEATVKTIEAAGGTALAVQGDVGSQDDVSAIVAQIADALGPVSVLVNNAGITRDGLLLRMSPDDWDSVVQTNLRSAYLCTKAVLRDMVRAKWGRIISVTSVAGIMGNPGQANYAAAKAGLIGFTKSVAREVSSRGITANAVAPGFVETDMTAELGDAAKEAARAQIPAGRFGSPHEVAAAVGYLASEDASYVTGQVVVVDGGMAM